MSEAPTPQEAASSESESQLEHLFDKQWAQMSPETRALVSNPGILHEIKRDLDIPVAGEDGAKLTLFLTCCSCGWERPLGLALLGGSGSGKSHLISSVLKYFPDSSVKHLTRVTGAYLDRLQTNLNGKILWVEELVGAEAGFGQLRISLSEGGLVLGTVQRDSKGNLTSVEITTQGWPVFVTSTTAPIIGDKELENRLLIRSLDESEEQTRKVLKHEAESFQRGWSARWKPNAAIRSLFDVSNLSPLPVTLPFAADVADLFPSKRTESRRDLPKLFQLTKISGWLHQWQRSIIRDEKYGGSHILADFLDLKYALEIAGPSISESLQRRPHHMTAILDLFTSEHPLWTPQAARLKLGLSLNRTRSLLNALMELGFVGRQEEKRPFEYFRNESAPNPEGLFDFNQLLDSWSPDRLQEWLKSEEFTIRLKRPDPTYVSSLYGLGAPSSLTEPSTGTIPQMVPPSSSSHQLQLPASSTHETPHTTETPET